MKKTQDTSNATERKKVENLLKVFFVVVAYIRLIGGGGVLFIC